MLRKSGIDSYLSQSFILKTWSKSLPWEHLGMSWKHFLSFLLPCILVTIRVAHHITSRCCCLAGCDCLAMSLFISTTLFSVCSSPLVENKLIYQNNGVLELKFIFSLISSPIVSQSRTMSLKISLLFVLTFKNTFLPLIYSVIHIGLS